MDKNEYQRYCEIRDKYGYKDSDVSKGANVTKSTFSDWKAGRYIPKQEKLQKIAEFLNVSVEYIKNGCSDSNEEIYYFNKETAEMAQQLFENKDLRVLFDAAKDASPEDLKTTHEMLMALKKKERGIIDD